MMIFADAATGGWIAGNIVAVVLLVPCVILAIYALYRVSADDHDRGLGLSVFAGSIVAILLIAGVYVWASWPFDYDYHHWVDKKVTVQAVSKRQVSDGKSFYEKFVVRDSTGVLYGIDDTRAALIKPGAELNLRCKKAYQFGIPRSAHGWDCRWSA